MAEDALTTCASDMELCGFVPVIGQDGERTTPLADGSVRLHHDEDQLVDPEKLAGVFVTPLTELWSRSRVGGQETFDGIWLRATVFDDTVCRVEVTAQALANGVRRPAVPTRSPALVSGSSLAHLIVERDDADPERPSRLGAAGYGPAGVVLARNLITCIDTWGRDRTATPRMTIHPAETPDSSLAPGHVIDKGDSRVVLLFPETTA
ncbi:hypothetical protein PZB75_12190 [Streptomyces sp. AM 4-1-1]|uniref:hypothetical protein n=1 Tax=Streptomyces sp. AM 4-1-1 TaxID=3028710 RepID=UPI0023B902D3|nr:hypothetical protein [Streptomyces sp. AM 4-1-1]WEH34061.1 hypothetical protein PZB75_12190 [Streptomyces sp. AM 4-1-1]